MMTRTGWVCKGCGAAKNEGEEETATWKKDKHGRWEHAHETADGDELWHGTMLESGIEVPWSEREAVVAYLLDLQRKWGAHAYAEMLALAAAEIALGSHMQAAREGRLDAYRERAREMCKKAGNGNG